MKITSLEGLKKWIYNPTEEKPIVLEWWLDWIVDECPKQYEDFQNAMELMVKFTERCENMQYFDAKILVIRNQQYWWERASQYKSKNAERFKQNFNTYIVNFLGVN